MAKVLPLPYKIKGLINFEPSVDEKKSSDIKGKITQMKVFKFGGASINTIERIKNVKQIISNHKEDKLLIIISAMGKTTNALEAVVNAYFNGNNAEALALFEKIKQQHLDTLKYLVTINWQVAENRLKDFFTEVEWMLHDKPVQHYDYYYDQIVCCGELLSTSIVYHYLIDESIDAQWVDVRDIVRTDNNFRDANIQWEQTEENVQKTIKPLLEKSNIVITQGFIGATDENESTTLGREGSDYSAAIFANILDAENVTIWKDVEAVMNADPKSFADAQKIDRLSFTEVIEMAYYGAQVIHPKTIKPLQNKDIPLLVKSFIDPSLPGTEISGKNIKNLPPVIVNKEKQVLLNFQSKDFSFVAGKPVDQLHEIFTHLKISPNISQNTAISLLCGFDDHPEKIEKIALEASSLFNVAVERNLQLLTIRHYNDETVNRFISGKEIVLMQKTPETIQVLYRQ